MRRNLFCLMLKGINYYKAPLMDNQQFVIDINEVIKAELISEHLLGSALKRDQINFVFKVLSVIFNANPQAREFLQKKDENCVKGSIPKLIAYHTILYMRAWRDRKKEDDLKQQKQEEQELQKQTLLQNSQLQSTQDENLANAQSSVYISPERKRQVEEEQKRKEEELKLAEETAREKEQQKLMDKYGRYWLWDFYCIVKLIKISNQLLKLFKKILIYLKVQTKYKLIQYMVILWQHLHFLICLFLNKQNQMLHFLHYATIHNAYKFQMCPTKLNFMFQRNSFFHETNQYFE